MNGHTMNLLMLAAKAVGQNTSVTMHSDGSFTPGAEYSFKPAGGIGGARGVSGWNPVDDDGDCARLEAALLLSVSWSESGVQVRCPASVYFSEDFGHHRGDRNAARRLASVRVAAVIGESMR